VGLKPAVFVVLGGMAEAVHFQHEVMTEPLVFLLRSGPALVIAQLVYRGGCAGLGMGSSGGASGSIFVAPGRMVDVALNLR
jgi:hypothetical protein